MAEVLQIKFGPTHGSGSEPVLLIELPDAMLTAAMNGDESLSFVGNPADLAVLCTRSSTYDVRLAETTNSLLLLPPETSATRNVAFTEFAYYVISPTVPRFSRLREILERSEFQGLEAEVDPSEDASLVRLTTVELLALVQCSEAELLGELFAMHAVLLDGFWRRIDMSHIALVVDHIITEATERDWALAAMSRAELSAALVQAGLAQPVVAHVLDAYCLPVGDDGQTCALNGDVVSRLAATQLLAASPEFHWELFSARWVEALPVEMQHLACPAQLTGIGVIRTEGLTKVVIRVDRGRLSSDPRLRFGDLFAIKPRWTKAELEPFIADIVSPGASLDQLLLKYARATGRPGVDPALKEYSSRH